MVAVFANNAVSSLAGAIDASQTTLTIQASDAAEYPSPVGGNWFSLTVIDSTAMEIMQCTGRSGTTLTVVRGREGTIGRAFPAGSKVSHRLTTGALNEFVQEAPSDNNPYSRRNKAWAQIVIPAAEPPITAGTAAQYWRGDKQWATHDKASVGLANVDNTTDVAKPVSTATQTALNLKENTANKGQPNGYASLDGVGKVPAAQLPAYVDDVVEYANLAAFPATGTTGVLYVALDTNKTYRWSGSAYTEISPSPGSTDSVPEGTINLYYTNARASAAAPVQSVNSRTGAVVVTKTDVGLGNVDNTSDALKPVSTAGAAADALRVLKAGDTMTGALTLPAGAAATPSIKFGASTNTGIYGGPASVTFGVNAADKLTVAETIITVNIPISLPADPLSALQAATKQYVDTKAPIANPAFTGNPTAPTPTYPDNDTSIATTAFVTTGLATRLTDAASDGKTYGRKNGIWAEFLGGVAQAAISDTPPFAPPPGAMWFESDTGNTYVYYVDADSSQWVQMNVFGTGANPASFLTITEAPTVGFSFSNPLTDMWFGIKPGPQFAWTNDPYGGGTNLMSLDKATGSLNVYGNITTVNEVDAGAVVTTGAVTVGGLLTATSPAFSGVPTVPTAAAGTNTTQAASTAYVTANGVPPGAIMMFAMNSVPTGWLKANGALVNRTTYARLFAAIGTLYGVGDGSTTFALPDARGEFPRFFDDGFGADPGRAIGSLQTDGVKSHVHVISFNTGNESATHTHTFSDTSGGRSAAHTHVASGTTSSVSANHTHTFSDSSSATGTGSANHSHQPSTTTLNFSTPNSSQQVGSSGGFITNTSSVATTDSVGAAHTHTVAVSGTTGSNSVGHTHTFSDTTTSESVDHTHAIGGTTPANTVLHTHAVSGTSNANTSATTENRPRNIALLACIKY